MPDIQARVISKREVSGIYRRAGAAFWKREPLIQNGRVETYEGGRVKDLHHVNHMYQIK